MAWLVNIVSFKIQILWSDVNICRTVASLPPLQRVRDVSTTKWNLWMKEESVVYFSCFKPKHRKRSWCNKLSKEKASSSKTGQRHSKSAGGSHIRCHLWHVLVEYAMCMSIQSLFSNEWSYFRREYNKYYTTIPKLKYRCLFEGGVASFCRFLVHIGFKWKKKVPRRNLMRVSNVAAKLGGFLRNYIEHKDCGLRLFVYGWWPVYYCWY